MLRSLSTAQVRTAIISHVPHSLLSSAIFSSSFRQYDYASRVGSSRSSIYLSAIVDTRRMPVTSQSVSFIMPRRRVTRRYFLQIREFCSPHHTPFTRIRAYHVKSLVHVVSLSEVCIRERYNGTRTELPVTSRRTVDSKFDS